MGAVGPAAVRRAPGGGQERVRLRRGLPSLHALPGGVVVPREDRLLLQKLPQGLQRRGAGLSAMSRSESLVPCWCPQDPPSSVLQLPPCPPASALASTIAS